MLQKMKNLIWMLYYGLYFWFYLTIWRPIEQWWRSLLEAFLPKARQKQIKQSIRRDQNNKLVESSFDCHFQRLFLHFLQEEEDEVSLSKEEENGNNVNHQENDVNDNTNQDEENDNEKESFFEEIDLIEDEFETKEEFIQFVNECCVECYGKEVVDAEAENILVYLEYKFRDRDFMIISNLKKIQENFQYPFWTDAMIENFMFRFFQKDVKDIQCIPLVNYMSEYSIHEGQTDPEKNQDQNDSEENQDQIDQDDVEDVQVDENDQPDQNDPEKNQDQTDPEENQDQLHYDESIENPILLGEESSDQNESIDDQLIVKDINELLRDDSGNKEREQMNVNCPDSPTIEENELVKTEQVEVTDQTAEIESSNQTQFNNLNFSPQSILQDVMQHFDPNINPAQQIPSILEKLLPKYVPAEKMPAAQQLFTQINNSNLLSNEKNNLKDVPNFFNQEDFSETTHTQCGSFSMTKKLPSIQECYSSMEEVTNLFEREIKSFSNHSPSSNTSSQSKRATEEANQLVRDLLLRLKGPSLQYFHGDLPFVYSDLIHLNGPIELYLAHVHQLDLLSCRVYWSDNTVDNLIV